MPKEKPYRLGVIGVFANQQGEILIGERADTPAAWQLPQGGIESGETPEQAIAREMHEELGILKFKTIKRSADYIGYDFTPGGSAPINQKYCGQKQIWFLLQTIDGHEANLSSALDIEFSQLKWEHPKKVLEGIVDWKKDSYLSGLSELELI